MHVCLCMYVRIYRILCDIYRNWRLSNVSDFLLQYTIYKPVHVHYLRYVQSQSIIVWHRATQLTLDHHATPLLSEYQQLPTTKTIAITRWIRWHVPTKIRRVFIKLGRERERERAHVDKASKPNMYLKEPILTHRFNYLGIFIKFWLIWWRWELLKGVSNTHYINLHSHKYVVLCVCVFVCLLIKSHSHSHFSQRWFRWCVSDSRLDASSGQIAVWKFLTDPSRPLNHLGATLIRWLAFKGA